MAREITVKLYKYSELPTDAAKERAREWWLDLERQDCNLEYTIEDIATCAKLLGIRLDQHTVPLHGGGTRYAPNIWYSLSYCQGDGACFDGYWDSNSLPFNKDTKAKFTSHHMAIISHVPLDEKLADIATHLDTLRTHPLAASGNFSIRCKHEGRYTHSGCMTVGLEIHEDPDGAIAEQDFDDLNDNAKQVMRSFADWMHKQLQADYEYKTSDEAAVEAIEANDYEFTEEGEFHS